MVPSCTTTKLKKHITISKIKLIATKSLTKLDLQFQLEIFWTELFFSVLRIIKEEKRFNSIYYDAYNLLGITCEQENLRMGLFITIKHLP
jgi:hypothetical protein